MTAIAGDPRIYGRIGVDTLNANVTLTGRVMNPAMAERAASDARGIDGVADVTNYIRARVGEE
jgi:osmotically-inducible protein OsmY